MNSIHFFYKMCYSSGYLQNGTLDGVLNCVGDVYFASFACNILFTIHSVNQ